MLTGLALGQERTDFAAADQDGVGPGLIPLPLAAQDHPGEGRTGEAEQPDHDHADHPADAPHGFVSPWWNGCSAPVAPPATLADLPAPEGYVLAPGVDPLAPAIGGLGVTYGETFRLHSLPGSRYTVFLDFDGHTTTGTNWNSYWKTSSFHSPAFSTDGSESFSASELVAIQRIWQRVAEYFSPFNINVTTEDPGAAGLTYSGASDPQFGIRVVITDEGGKPWGGIGYVGSFAWGSDTPVFVYADNLADNAKYIADCVAHEVGHSLGLSHDGRGGDAYYWGHGGWAPVMGAGYDAPLVQWSNGAYSGATTTQDDLAIITGSANMGVAWRADDHGNSFATATPLAGAVSGGVTTVAAYGIIAGSGSRNDVDMFRFDLAPGGSISFTVSAWSRVFVAGSSEPLMVASPFSMLDVGLVLYDAGQRVVASWNDTTRVDAALQLSGLAGGTYYLAVDGVGWGDPMAASPTGWTEYGSLGQYMIRGTYTSGAPEPLTLRFDQAAATTTEAGGAAVVTLRATGATGDVLVQLGGLDAREGSLSATSLLLNAANNWTAQVTISGRDDRDADDDVTCMLRAEAAGAIAAALAVTNLDDDRGAAQALTVTTSTNGKGVTRVTQTVVDAAATRSDDGAALQILESGGSPNFAFDARWKFEGLAAGDWRVQVDAASPREAFVMEYSIDGAQSWLGFAGGGSGALAWDGSWVARGVVDTLWIRLADVVRSGDSVRNAVHVDLLTIAPEAVRVGSGAAGGAPAVTLHFDRAAVTTSEAGAAARVTLRAAGADGDVLVRLAGLDAREGGLSATSLLLNAANDWTAEILVTGRDDRAADGDVTYTLVAEAAGAVGASLAVTNLDDDRAAAEAVAFTVATNAQGVTRVTQAVLPTHATRADDGEVLQVLETGGSPNFAVDARWKFEGLTAGSWRVQVDAASPREAFRLQYSTDGAQSWQGFAGAPEGALGWDGSWTAVGVEDSLWVRVVDLLREGDSVRNAIHVDLLTIAPDALWG